MRVVGQKNPSLEITVCHHSASLVMPKGDPRDGFSTTLTLMIESLSPYNFQGDGGAPLVCPDSDGVVHLVGLPFLLAVSDCNFGLVVYTRISAHRKWIEDNQAHG